MEARDNTENRAAMTCARCGIMSTILFGPEPEGYVDALPDPFEWQCRFCGHRQSCAKSSLQVMTAAQAARPTKWA